MNCLKKDQTEMNQTEMSLGWQGSNTIFKLELMEKLRLCINCIIQRSLSHVLWHVRESQLHVNSPIEMLALGSAFQSKHEKCKMQQKDMQQVSWWQKSSGVFTLNVLTASVVFTICYCVTLTADTYHENKTEKNSFPLWNAGHCHFHLVLSSFIRLKPR